MNGMLFRNLTHYCIMRNKNKQYSEIKKEKDLLKKNFPSKLNKKITELLLKIKKIKCTTNYRLSMENS